MSYTKSFTSLSKPWQVFTYVYFTFCSIDVLSLSFGGEFQWLHVLMKPLLMIMPIIFLWRFLRSRKYFSWMFAAFIFSWFGDVFLLGQELNPLFFIGGLTSFLLAHVSYVVLFTKSSLKKQLKTKWISCLMVLTLLFAIGYYLYLYPYLNDLSIPVLVYVSAIALMGLTALWCYGSVNHKAFRLTVYGAFTFIVSDAILAFNKFVQAFDWADVFIMTSYCLAQYLILKGFFMQQELKNS